MHSTWECVCCCCGLCWAPAHHTAEAQPADGTGLRHRRTAIGPWTCATHDVGPAVSSSSQAAAAPGAISDGSAMSGLTAKPHLSPRRVPEITPIEDGEH